MSFARMMLLGAVTIGGLARSGVAQTSSVGGKARAENTGRIEAVPPREAPRVERNGIYERFSWITVRPTIPRTFKVGDLLTIIVRENRRFEADADLETKSRFDATSEIEAFAKLIDGGLGTTTFARGRPNIDYRFDSNLKKEGDTQREDRMTTRLTGKIIDVKPNGLLVLEAKSRIQHDDEVSIVTLTGTCRKEDVTADNSVLSTQIADKDLVVDNEGALRAASSRGWIPRLIDLVKPF
jgi:flagellar L-ring protein precursor FlgH